MKVKGKYNYDYLALNLRSSVVKRFRHFARKVATSQSEALELMISFFEWHGFAPSDRLGLSFLQELLKNRKLTETSIKRTEASIAIIRDIEITQTKPTNAILEALLEQKGKPERPKVEPKSLNQEPAVEITVPKIRYERLRDKMQMLLRESQYIVENTALIKPSFGKPYLRLDITQGELENYKRTLQNL